MEAGSTPSQSSPSSRLRLPLVFAAGVLAGLAYAAVWRGMRGIVNFAIGPHPFTAVLVPIGTLQAAVALPLTVVGASVVAWRLLFRPPRSRTASVVVVLAAVAVGMLLGDYVSNVVIGYAYNGVIQDRMDLLWKCGGAAFGATAGVVVSRLTSGSS